MNFSVSFLTINNLITDILTYLPNIPSYSPTYRKHRTTHLPTENTDLLAYLPRIPTPNYLL